MKRRYVTVRPGLVVLVVGIALGLSGCEQFFTSSLLSSLRRDPSTLSTEQKVTFAEQALASGDPTAMKEAFTALVGTGAGSNLTASQRVLAVEVGIGATNIQSTSAEIGAQYLSGQDSTSTINAAASSIDPALVSQMSSILNTVSASDGVTADDYTLAAVTLALVAVQTAGGVASLPSGPFPTSDSNLNQAKTYFDTAQSMLQASGQSTDTVSGVAGLFNA